MKKPGPEVIQTGEGRIRTGEGTVFIAALSFNQFWNPKGFFKKT